MNTYEFEELVLVRDFNHHICIGEDLHLVTYNTNLNYDLIEENGLDIINV